MRIAEPARKHGVADDIWHALRNAIRRIPADDEMMMLFGPARNGAPLEIGVLDPDGDDPVVMHAMPLRPSWLRFLG